VPDAVTAFPYPIRLPLVRITRFAWQHDHMANVSARGFREVNVRRLGVEPGEVRVGYISVLYRPTNGSPFALLL
jgi:hypothetical protein